MHKLKHAHDAFKVFQVFFTLIIAIFDY